jgi:hypothetical protein
MWAGAYPPTLFELLSSKCCSNSLLGSLASGAHEPVDSDYSEFQADSKSDITCDVECWSFDFDSFEEVLQDMKGFKDVGSHYSYYDEIDEDEDGYPILSRRLRLLLKYLGNRNEETFTVSSSSPTEEDYRKMLESDGWPPHGMFHQIAQFESFVPVPTKRGKPRFQLSPKEYEWNNVSEVCRRFTRKPTYDKYVVKLIFSIMVG